MQASPKTDFGGGKTGRITCHASFKSLHKALHKISSRVIFSNQGASYHDSYKIESNQRHFRGYRSYPEKTAETLDILLAMIKDTLASGETFRMSNFGKFCIPERRERLWRNAANGKLMHLQSGRIACFKSFMKRKASDEFLSCF